MGSRNLMCDYNERLEAPTNRPAMLDGVQGIEWPPGHLIPVSRQWIAPGCKRSSQQVPFPKVRARAVRGMGKPEGLESQPQLLALFFGCPPQGALRSLEVEEIRPLRRQVTGKGVKGNYLASQRGSRAMLSRFGPDTLEMQLSALTGAYSKQTGQPFHVKLDTHSTPNWTVGA